LITEAEAEYGTFLISMCVTETEWQCFI